MSSENNPYGCKVPSDFTYMAYQVTAFHMPRIKALQLSNLVNSLACIGGPPPPGFWREITPFVVGSPDVYEGRYRLLEEFTPLALTRMIAGIATLVKRHPQTHATTTTATTTTTTTTTTTPSLVVLLDALTERALDTLWQFSSLQLGILVNAMGSLYRNYSYTPHDSFFHLVVMRATRATAVGEQPGGIGLLLDGLAMRGWEVGGTIDYLIMEGMIDWLCATSRGSDRVSDEEMACLLYAMAMLSMTFPQTSGILEARDRWWEAAVHWWVTRPEEAKPLPLITVASMAWSLAVLLAGDDDNTSCVNYTSLYMFNAVLDHIYRSYFRICDPNPYPEEAMLTVSTQF